MASDLIDHFRLEAEILPGYTRHVSFRSDPAQGRRKVRIEKRWRTEKELGTGGCAVVTLEAEEKGDRRAVKAISKSFCLEARIDYKKELYAMIKLSRVSRALFVR